MSYIKQLDSVRGVAILLVLIAHWLPETHSLNVVTSVINPVDVFFVLSGFLITRILLKDREGVEELGLNKFEVIKAFLAKRMLRIFPIYLLLIFILFIFGQESGTGIRSNYLYFITYTSNFLFFRIQRWDGMLSHLWSLSVQEQFYFFWPLIIIFTHKKRLLLIIVLSIFIGVIGQILLRDFLFGDILTFSCLDGFGIGALFAYSQIFKPIWQKKYYNIILYLAFLCFLLQIIRVASNGEIILLPSRTLTSVCALWLILYININLENLNLLSRIILDNRALIFLGKISYGVYLYHLVIPYFAKDILTFVNSLLPLFIYKYNFYILIFENFCLLLLVSFISWKVIEQPFLKLRKFVGGQNTSIVKLESVSVK